MRIPVAPKHRQGFYEARPGDVAGQGDLLLVDVRDEPELTGEYGHIHGVVHRPSKQILSEGLPDQPMDRPIVLVCDNGFRSRKCAAHLVQRGYTEIYHLVGGMRRWTAEERPIARVPTWVAGPASEPGDDAGRDELT